ncbi:MAG: thiamine phosphate synthase [Ginsengibacter sp.]
MLSKLQYISQGVSKQEQLDNIKSVLDAGGEWIQLRFKNADEKLLTQTANEIMMLKDRYSFTFIINDFAFIAKTVNADGVHLGLEDMQLLTARNIVGDKKIIGGTANTIDHVVQRIKEGCNYIGLGPFRFTTTKQNLSPVLGFGGYQGILQVLQENKHKTPVFAIGGITVNDLPGLVNAGIYGVAVSGLLTNEKEKSKIIEQINTILNGKVDHSRETV